MFVNKIPQSKANLNKESDKAVDEMVFSDSDKSTEENQELDDITLNNIKFIA